MANLDNDVKVVSQKLHNDENWLRVQVEKAAKNLLEKPIERRGPNLISDDDINNKFRIR